jgi:3-hydroxybutyryl-CoA dehydrogenase
MGTGIAQTAAQSGLAVRLIDVDARQLRRADEAIRAGLARLVERGRLSEQRRAEALEHLATSTDPSDAAAADLVIEAVPEQLEVKASLLGQLDRICREGTVLASNTSSISITRLAAATGRPDRVVGMHFFNPVPVMRLVEIVRGERTSDDTRDLVQRVAEDLGKTAVEVQDYPGFVSNRLLMPMINEAAFALMEGVASREAIDGVMRLGMNHPMGPLELADFIGLDVCLHIMRVLQEGLGDDKYRPCPLLARMVAAGKLGRKSGRGFYEYPAS